MIQNAHPLNSSQMLYRKHFSPQTTTVGTCE